MAEIRRIGATSDILGEGPVWDTREQAFYWVDIRAPAVRRYDWRTARVQSWAMPEMVGSLAVRERGGLLLAMRSSLSFFDPNSLAWSPDGGILYFADSSSRIIQAYPYDTTAGAIGQPREFHRVDPPAIPDGATVDAEGYLWSACYDGWRILRIAPGGGIDRTVELPVQRPTSCQFAGPNLDVLFVTTAKQKLTPEELARQPLAGALLAIDVGVKGLPEARYAG